MLLELMPKELRIHLESANLEGLYIYVDREKENALGKIKEATLKITYPLKNPATFQIPEFSEMVRGGYITDLLGFVIDCYKAIYRLEEETQSKPTPPVEERTGLINRPESDGSYGIWGHDLGDLVLWGVEINTETGEITLGVDS